MGPKLGSSHQETIRIMNPNTVDTSLVCFCVYVFISLHMSLHTGDIFFVNAGDGKWEREMRGGAELHNSVILHSMSSMLIQNINFLF